MRSIKDVRPDNTANGNDLSDKYDGLSQDELMGELMRTVSSAKSDGSFSPEQLDEFVEFVSPSLDEQSVERLKELVDLIKGR